MDNKRNKLAVTIVAFFMTLGSISFAQEITTKEDSLSYSIGIVLAQELRSKGIKEVKVEMLSKAMSDYMSGARPAIGRRDSKAMMDTHVAEIKEKKAKKGEMARIESEKFLAENTKKPGVTTTESGLQYEIIKKGDGKLMPELTDKVRTHYHGMLLDGSVFDSSVDRGEPISFPLNRVIKGWQEGLQLMAVGDKFRFFIPSDLAYGERGGGDVIPPHAALIFEVELLGVNED